MLVTKYIEIDAGHRVPNHKSKCKSPHGHRYKIELGVDDKVISTQGTSDEGMVIDFSDLKTILTEVVDKGFDHAFIYYEGDIYQNFYEQMFKDGLKLVTVSVIPTAENLAKLWFELMAEPLKRVNIRIHHVTVWETPTSTATYEGKD